MLYCYSNTFCSNFTAIVTLQIKILHKNDAQKKMCLESV